MNEYFYLVILIVCLALALLVGCSPVIEPPEPPLEPELHRIEITPNYTELLAGYSVQLIVTGYSEESEEVGLDEASIYWSKCCPSGTLSPLTGYTIVFKSTKSSSGIMQIYCSYGEFSDKARINIMGVM
jgi:hypothetical protein